MDNVKDNIHKEPDQVIELSRSRISFFSNYPAENRPGAVQDITDAMAQCGLFDGLKANPN